VREVVVALPMPFRADGAVDEGALAEHVDFLVAVEHELGGDDA
jgi:dihydrodipicolinate synthase/N-acetylneuraminate lyase